MPTRVISLAIAATALTARAQAQTSTMDVQSMAVVPAVLIIVDGVTSEAEADGLFADTLRRDLERMLHRAGIVTLTETEWQNTLGNPALQLRLKLTKPSPHLYLYSGTLELRQLTILVLDSTKAAFAPTWSAGTVLGTAPTVALPSIRRRVTPLVRKFIDTYRAATRPSR